jgi:hypothetical protein
MPLGHNDAIDSDGRAAYAGFEPQGTTAIPVLDRTDMKKIAKVPLDKTLRGLIWVGWQVALFHRRSCRCRVGTRDRDELDGRPDCQGRLTRRLSVSRWRRNRVSRLG